MELREYLLVLRKHWIVILVTTLVGLGVAVAVTATTPRTHTATAQSFIAVNGTDQGASVELQRAQFAQERVKSYTMIVSSPEVLNPVIAVLDLPYSTEELAASVSATNPSSTVLIDVSVTNQDPNEAAKIANATALSLGRTIEKIETPDSVAPQPVPSESTTSTGEQLIAPATQVTSPVKVSLVQPATPPTSPSAPKRMMNYALGLLLGLAAGLAWAFLRNALDTSVRTPVQLEELTQAPQLGAVLFNADAKKRPLTALDTTSVDSEGYRTVRTNLQFIGIDDSLGAFVITSAAPGDGKTTVACNLAIAIAQSGKRVCLVEADLRRPKVAQYLGLTASVGLTDVLAGQSTLEGALQTWNRGLLSVLAPGRIPANPSELLGPRQMSGLIGKLREQFDMVILDSSPLLAVSDASVLCGHTNGAVLVARSGRSSRDDVQHAVGALERANAKVLGTVLNAVPAKQSADYGYGYLSDIPEDDPKPSGSAQGPVESAAKTQ